MDVVKLTALLVAVALICTALRVQRPEMATALSLAAGAMALLWATDAIAASLADLRALAAGAGARDASGTVLLRAAGVSVLTEFGAELCRDAGERALGGRIALGGRVALLVMSLPLLTGLLRRLLLLLP